MDVTYGTRRRGSRTAAAGHVGARGQTGTATPVPRDHTAQVHWSPLDTLAETEGKGSKRKMKTK